MNTVQHVPLENMWFALKRKTLPELRQQAEWWGVELPPSINKWDALIMLIQYQEALLRRA